MAEVVAPLCWAVLTIRMEARNQPHDGQVAVANVIRNRMAQRYSSDGSVAGTVLWPLQFSCWNATDPQRIRGCQVSWEDPAIQAAQKAWEDSAGRSVVGDAVLYHTVAKPRGARVWPPPWALSNKIERVATVGDHVFYRVKE